MRPDGSAFEFLVVIRTITVQSVSAYAGHIAERLAASRGLRGSAAGAVAAQSVVGSRAISGSLIKPLSRRFVVERVTRIELALSAWEFGSAVHPVPADSLTCRCADALPDSDRDYPRLLTLSGTQRARGASRSDRSARTRGELRDALRADAEQGSDIAHRHSPCDQFCGSLARAGGSRSSDLISLPSQLADLPGGGIQAGIAGVILELQHKARHRLIRQVSCQYHDLPHGLIQCRQAASVGMGALQRRHVSEPVTVIAGDDHAVSIAVHRSQPFPSAASRSRSIARNVPAAISPECCGTVVATVASAPFSSLKATTYRRCEPTWRIMTPPSRSIRRFTSRAFIMIRLAARHINCQVARQSVHGTVILAPVSRQPSVVFPDGIGHEDRQVSHFERLDSRP
jgi:hypothetical protein